MKSFPQVHSILSYGGDLVQAYRAAGGRGGGGGVETLGVHQRIHVLILRSLKMQRGQLNTPT